MVKRCVLSAQLGVRYPLGACSGQSSGGGECLCDGHRMGTPPQDAYRNLMHHTQSSVRGGMTVLNQLFDLDGGSNPSPSVNDDGL